MRDLIVSADPGLAERSRQARWAEFNTLPALAREHLMREVLVITYGRFKFEKRLSKGESLDNLVEGFSQAVLADCKDTWGVTPTMSFDFSLRSVPVAQIGLSFKSDLLGVNVVIDRF